MGWKTKLKNFEIHTYCIVVWEGQGPAWGPLSSLETKVLLIKGVHMSLPVQIESTHKT